MNILELLPKVYAQSDSVSEPTFGSIDLGSGTNKSASILISSTSTQVEIGDTFKISVEVKTNDIPINEYQIRISYDSTVFSVIDQDTNTTGVQVSLLDTVFESGDLEEDNKVTSSEIVLNASLSESSSLTVNRDVVEITFQAQKTAISTISVVTGTNGSKLIRSNGSTLSYNSNEVSIDVITQSGGDTNYLVDNNTGGTASQNPPITTIPDTAITDSLEGSIGLGLGVSLILIGIVLVLRKKK